MTLSFMRKVDRYLGIPLLFILTCLLKPFYALTKRKPIKRVAFLELSEMGSTILADPAMRKIQAATDAELYFVIFKKNACSLRLLNTIAEDNVFEIRADSFGHLVQDVFKLLTWFRTQRIDTIIDLELFSRITALLSALSGAHNRVGFYRYNTEGLYRGRLMTHPVQYNPLLHISKNFIALINSVLSDSREVPFSKQPISNDEINLVKPSIDLEAKQALRQRIQQAHPRFDPQSHRLILINANASELLPQRCWPTTHYAKLIHLLLTQNDHLFILLTGAPSESKRANELETMVNNPHCVNFCGGVPFLELPTLYSISHLMVTNDSGPGHFSATTRLRTLVLFGPESPDIYGPLGERTRTLSLKLPCSPCVSAANHRHTPCTNNVCMQNILPQQVYQKIEDWLDISDTL